MRFVWVLLIAIVLAGLIGCVLTPEQQEKLDKLKVNLEATRAEIAKTAAQIERLYILQEAVRDAVKQGEMTPEMALEKLAQLEKEAKEAVEHYTFLKEKGGALLADYKVLKEAGVPWWQTAWAIVSTILAMYGGKRAFEYRGAAVDCIMGVEKANNPQTKQKIAALGNGLIKKLVKKYT